MSGGKWAWWAGRNEEEFTIAGPCRTREEAIDHAYGSTEPGDMIFLVEAVASVEVDPFTDLMPFLAERNASHVIRGEDADCAGAVQERAPDSEFVGLLVCSACKGEGAINHPFLEGAYGGSHSEYPSDPPLVQCEDCDGTGHVASEARKALQWYAEQVAGCRKIGSAGDTFRHALDRDGGKRARDALSGGDTA